MNWLTSLLVDSFATTNEKKKKLVFLDRLKWSLKASFGILVNRTKRLQYSVSGIEMFWQFHDVLTFLIIFRLFIVTSHHVLVLIASTGGGWRGIENSKHCFNLENDLNPGVTYLD